jgi:hypothetical protein
MPLLIVGDEKNVAGLRKRLFAGRVSNATVGRVTAALQEANPHVDLEKLRPGVVLTVPDLPELAVADLSFDDTIDRAIVSHQGDLRERIEALQAAADQRARADAAERKRIRPTLDDKAVQAAVRKDQELAALVAAAGQALDAESAAAKERAERLRKAAEGWTEELEALKTIRPR